MDDIEDLDCPVCLEDTRLLPGLPVIIPCCRKVYCRDCVIALVGAQKNLPGAEEANQARAANTLVCPTCRAEHHVPEGKGSQWASKLALKGDASSWGGMDARTAALAEKEASVDPTLCIALSREELVAVCAAVDGVHHDTMRVKIGSLPRAGLVEEAARRLGSSAGHQLPVSQLSIRAARAVLTLRDIPYGDVLEKEELCKRVEQSHRGACHQLPTKLLKKMLAAEGLGDEVWEDKANLSRRLMAVRALRRPHANWYADKPGRRNSTEDSARVHAVRASAAQSGAATTAASHRARETAPVQPELTSPLSTSTTERPQEEELLRRNPSRQRSTSRTPADATSSASSNVCGCGPCVIS